MPRPIDAQTYNLPQVQDALRETGELIEAARKARGWSQSELGQRLGGIDRRHVGTMEKGDANTDFGLVVGALWVLDVPVLETLITGREAHPSPRLPGSRAVTTRHVARPGVSKRSAHGVGLKRARRSRKRVIDNDF